MPYNYWQGQLALEGIRVQLDGLLILSFHLHAHSQVEHGVAAGKLPGLRQDLQRLPGKRYCFAASVGQN